MTLLATDLELTRNSYYAATAPRTQTWSRLEGTTSCDVAVVGGGLAGLSAALELRQRGLSVVLLEAREVGYGASGRNGGQAIHGLGCEQGTIEAQLGLDDARRAWDVSIEALDLLREQITAHQIDCDWQDGYLGLATTAGKGADLQAWADRTEKVYGYPLQRIGPEDIGRWISSPRFHSGIHDPRSGHMHPLKYTLGLARAAAAAGVRIHEQSPVTALRQGPQPVLLTSHGQVQAKQVLLAANVYLNGLAPTLATRIMPVGTYIACSEVLPADLARSLIPSQAAVCDTNFVLDYFRPTPDHRVLYGGRVSYSTTTPADLPQSMRARMVRTFPQLADVKVDYAWGGFVDISMNRAPDFGRLPAVPGAGEVGTQNVYYLQGFSGHGLSLAGMAGRLVAEAMTGDASRFDVFARLKHRAFPGGDLLRTPALVLAMAWFRLRDMLG
jgi:gamma-glutamylputrescine oxidase